MAHGKSLEIVSQVEIETPHGHIAASLPAAAWAAYVCEVCNHLPETLPDREAWELLAIALAFFDVHANDFAGIDDAGLWFEARFLAHQGYAPTLGMCVGCGAKISVPRTEKARSLAFSPRLGGNLCPNCALRDPKHLPVTVEALRTLHHLGRAPLPLSLAISAPARTDLATLLRRSLAIHLGARFRSRAFLDEIRAGELLSRCSPEKAGE